MLKAFKFRLYPKRSQVTKLNAQLAECCWLYNHLLEQRKKRWDEEKLSTTFFDQCLYITQLKKDRTSLRQVGAQSLQQVAQRLDLAFKAFFRRCKAGETAGYPRFKGVHRYRSLDFPQLPHGCVIKGDRITLTGVGTMRAVMHRAINGKAKTATVTRSSTGKWYLILHVEINPAPLPDNEKSVGIDMGLSSFLTRSDGGKVPNPRFFEADEQARARAQRRMAKAEQKSIARSRARQVVARISERIRFRRGNFAHQQSRKIINEFGTVAVEDLNINALKQLKMAKSISSVSWGIFLRLLAFKAEEAGRRFVAVNPAYTTQDCSKCGARQKLSLSQRVYNCPDCRMSLDRDVNAARNILRVGLHSLDIRV